MSVPIKAPVFPLNRMARLWLDQTLAQLKFNFMMQQIWPTEVYPGYAAINAQKKDGEWKSTGEGAKSFTGQIINATSAKNFAIAISYNNYLRFVDMGVGAGTKYGDVDNSRKAHYKRRYISVWNRKEGQSQRPAIMMEFRHLQGRIARNLADHYGFDAEFRIIKTFEDIGNIDFRV